TLISLIRPTEATICAKLMFQSSNDLDADYFVTEVNAASTLPIHPEPFCISFSSKSNTLLLLIVDEIRWQR
ncbi:unnamed protein product, partial [Musa banksii]